MTDTDTPKPKAKLRIRLIKDVVVPIAIDGQNVAFRITRLEGEAFETFRRQFRRVTADEELLQGIAERKLVTMTDIERGTFDRLRREADDAGQAFLLDAVTRFVTAEPGQLWEDNATTGESREIVTGAELARVFASHRDVLFAMLREIMRVSQHVFYDEPDPPVVG